MKHLTTTWKVRLLCTLVLSSAGANAAIAAKPAIQFDHIWLVVSPNAPERAVLERAGFRISPNVNRNDGQGTASVAFEFYNSYLELMWPDSTVSVAPGAERAAEKFRQRMLWRSSGWCPIGIGMHRISAVSTPLPVPTWSITPDWMRPGTAIEILTPREDTTSPSLFLEPEYLAVSEAANMKTARSHSKDAAMFAHPIGVKRITSIRLVAPKSYRPIEALTYVQNSGILAVDRGAEWAVELTFDKGRRGKTRDLRPALPRVVRS